VEEHGVGNVDGSGEGTKKAMVRDFKCESLVLTSREDDGEGEELQGSSG
jgi:hypothetical protein